MAPTVTGLYGGIGSGLIGAKWAGFTPIHNHEPRDYFNADTWNFNFRGVTYTNNIRPIDKRPNLIVGNPSCNIFSTSANRAQYTIDGDTIQQTDIFKCFGIIEMYEPDYFIIENIPPLLKRLELGQTGIGFNVFEERVFLKNYKISITKLNSLNFGVPQSRRRIFIVGCKEDCKAPVRLTTRRDVGKHEIGYTVYEGFEGLTEETPNNEMPYHSGERREGLGKLKAEESYYRAQNNKRLNIRKPSPVVTSSASRAVHPTQARVLTVRETARLMGYPDDFIFFGGTIDQLNQIGKAIVPQVVYSICLDIREHRKKNAIR